MTNNIVNEVAGELGISATNIVAELAKLKIMQNTFWVCVCTITALLFLFLLIREEKKEYSDDDISIVYVVMIVVMFVCTVCFTYELSNWLASPQIKAMQYIINRMG